MLELRLHGEDCLDHDLLNFLPNLVSVLTRSRLTRFRWRLRHQPRQTITDSQLVFLIIKIVVPLVQTVVGQVHVNVLHVVRAFVLFTRQAHQPILVEEYCHGVDYACH